MMPIEIKVEKLLNKLTILESKVDKQAEKLVKLEKFYSEIQDIVHLVPNRPDQPDRMNQIVMSEVMSELPFPLAVLLSLPDHLRKTVFGICKLGVSTALDISKVTGRVRAIESAYGNALCVMGYVKKERRKKQVYFSLTRQV